ncbi:MAG: bifunctional precorrin-2 dehydrogenase/sirohydrochlorin ferrochelatase [Deltaproteobacteria bacterium]|jgi:precorrin-2 dehydrogenase/sirohydrochlorin ferrochelatase|nr:bifunctional precorrin-2 dehydrogenase/sirohydrochlorin ferrochelatase [Deltaproteobacteria bacterium]
MRYYPINLDIQGKRCLVVGGGSVGARKVITLLNCGAAVTVVSPRTTEKLNELAKAGSITLRNRSYRTTDLKDVFLVIGATDDESLNQKISSDADSHDILCNIADRPAVCNFILPSIVHRGDLVITISTSGKSPALAKNLRKTLERQFGEEYAVMLQLMGAIREKLLRQAHEPEAHKHLFNQLIDNGLLEMIREGRKDDINGLLENTLGHEFKYDALIDSES